MKPAKSILALLAIFGAVSAASAAPTVVHITGSTAYRANTNTAILKSFDNGTTVKVGSTNAALGSSGASFFHGTMGGQDVIVETKFTGSVGGIKAVTSGASLDFLPDDTDTRGGVFSTVDITASASPSVPSFGSTVGSNGLCQTPGNPNPSVNLVPAEVTMSDTFQSATLFRSPALSGAIINGGANSAEIVGVVPFLFFRTPSSTAAVNTLTNMTPKTANLLFGNGSLPLAFWSGSSADETKIVYAAGRDPDSGTRLTTFAETGLGANATVVQYSPLTQDSTATGVSQAGSITGVQVFPDTTVTNLNQIFRDGNAGESSGGTLAGYIAKEFNTGTPGALVAYSGTGDAGGAITKGAVPLTWNGVAIWNSVPALGGAMTFDFTNIQNGKYSFWGYEHVLYLSGTLPAKKAVANKVASQLFNTDAQILLSTMRVSRQVDGGIVGPRY